MKKSRLLLLIFGMLAALLSFNLHSVLSAVDPNPWEESISKTVYESGFGMPYSCPYCWESNEIKITYPDKIRLGDSAVVEVTLEADGPMNFRIDGLPKSLLMAGDYANVVLDEAIEIACSGANFTIKPQDAIELKAVSVPPFEWKWSVAPKSSGAQSLVLDLGDLRIAGSQWMAQYDALRQTQAGDVDPFSLDIDPSFVYRGQYFYLNVIENGIERQLTSFSELRSETLHIEVLTPLGISDRAFFILKYGLAFISFVLMYPAISALLSKLSGRLTEKKEKPKILVP